ncbi:heavy metal translocating P-type ATPase [Paenibacillus sp. N1-5-1-14]|uniref:heavy metal translocating P-type ATPase n=1 Tax=Paenibacillus radicibacter TaxID=2972488 RepID=UPI0021591BAE|nr:heavy metal translocating P-type ATPase [Paenibacillus radicibacter]MCR8643249.1 heavy metal translocating P-type ATPase [Paenibacillus radicibacter]
MQEFRIKGLSCANCARELEEKIQKLEHGEGAKLSYNSGKLWVQEQISIATVTKILKKDGAYIASGTSSGAAAAAVSTHSHAHSHSHEGGCCSSEHTTNNVQAHQHEHGHDHSHDHGANANKRIRNQLIGAFVAYLIAIFLPSSVPSLVPIALYLFAIAISGYTTFIKGLKNITHFKFNIDTLMTIALIGAVSIGEWKEATLVAILFGVNELLEGFGMEKARRSMETLLQVAPKEALLIENGMEKVVSIDSLKVGDIVLVRSGQKIPSDGIVVEGRSSVNESAITGESLPLEKNVGETVFGGSVNNEGVLKVQLEKAYQDSSLAKILHLVEEAQETKTPTELFINRFAKYYTPIIIIVALLVIVVPPLFFGGDWGKWLYQGLAVLIVGCPCALILSSPIAIVSGITRNARNGILVKGGVFLEQLGKIKTIAFDKTGTLTKGKPHVAKTVVYDESFYQIAASIEKSSSHPLAKAIMKEMTAKGVTTIEPEDIRTVSGQGIVAQIAGQSYWVGNEKNMDHLVIPGVVQHQINDLKEQGYTLVLVANTDDILGIFGIADEIREESREVIAALHHAGIKRTVMLTGDHQKTAEKVARAVGVTDYYGNLLPEDKVEKVKELSRHDAVAMIGDGINDAPALATAQLGIAMGKGTDSAIETADIVLMQDHLGKLPAAVSIAKKVNHVIKLNIGISLGLKIIALLLTIPGWLTLWFAILSDMGATILVTLISLTVLMDNKDKS